MNPPRPKPGLIFYRHWSKKNILFDSCEDACAAYDKEFPPPVWCEPDILPGLFRQSILDEKSDIRAHVSAGNKTIYVFDTCEAVAAIKRTFASIRTAEQNGVVGITGQGWIVKITDILGIRAVAFPEYPLWDSFPKDAWSTSPKGEFAQDCIFALIDACLFPFKMTVTREQRRDKQRLGIDAVAIADKKIEIKCDYPTAWTGNLFLQHAERNDLKRH